MIIRQIFLCLICLSFLCSSCSKKTDMGPGVYTIAFSNMTLSPANLLPSDTSTQTQAVGVFNILGDSALNYDLYFTKLKSGLVPNGAAIYYGNPVTNGTLAFNLDGIKFNSSNEAIGKITLPHNVIDSIIAKVPMYIIITSATAPNGIVRGQVTLSNIGYAQDITLSSTNIKPAIPVAATATVQLRLLADGVTLYSMVTPSGIPSNDVLLSASLRRKTDSVAVLNFASSASEFNQAKMQTITTAIGTSIQKDTTYYLDVRTTLYPKGIALKNLR